MWRSWINVFKKLCSNTSINVCLGFEKCNNFVPDGRGFFDKSSCENIIGWRDVY